jgi:hypothetical protein
MARYRKILLYVGITILSFNAFGQNENCELTLTQATEEFQAGHFYSIPAILSRCLDKFTAEQQLRANILLTQTYLLLDDPVGAKHSYLAVLQANPEFVADPNIHSIDVVYLSKKFTASPVFSWFGKVGTNLSPVRVIYDNDAFGQASAKEAYSLKPGYQLGAGGDLYLFERIGLRAEVNYLFSTYEHNTSHYFEEDKKKFTDRQHWLAAPVTVMYEYNLGKYRPYGYAGYGVGYLIRDVANISIENILNAEVGKDEKESPDLNFIEKRNRWNQSIIFGAGVKMKFGLHFLFVDLRYSVGLKNIVDPANLYTNSGFNPESGQFIGSGESIFSYAHTEDYFRLDNLSLSFGFLQPLYKARELKRARTRSVSKKIKAQENETL